MEGDTVDGTEMPFDPAELLLIGSVEEPETNQECLTVTNAALNTCTKQTQHHPGFSYLASNFPILVEVVVTSMASCPPPITT